jgi:hypothetical protein
MGFVRFQNHISTSTHGSISVNTGRWSVRSSVPTLERGNDRECDLVADIRTVGVFELFEFMDQILLDLAFFL